MFTILETLWTPYVWDFMVASSHRHPFSLLKGMGVGADNSKLLITIIHPEAYPELPHWNKDTPITQEIVRVSGVLCQEPGAETNTNISYYTSQYQRGRVSQNLNPGWQLTALFKATWDLWRGPRPPGGLCGLCSQVCGPSHSLALSRSWKWPRPQPTEQLKENSHSMKNAPPVCLTSCIFPCGRWNSLQKKCRIIKDSFLWGVNDIFHRECSKVMN